MTVVLFFTGLLAGFEVLVRYGLRVPLGELDQRTQIPFRKALILRLRFLVPAAFLPAAVSAVVVAVMDGRPFLYAGLTALLVWAVATFGGTVPINSAALTWDPETPPDNWRTLVARWDRLDAVRTAAALVAFACFLVAAA
ncbi:MAG: DUF1772 domain-containing protein [Actinoplanes sp.]